MAPTGEWRRIEIDGGALERNLSQFAARLHGGARLLAVVKANGYGHGLVIAARAFVAGGAHMLGVHTLDEALCLREAGISDPVLILGPLRESEIGPAAHQQVEITVASVAAARAAVRAAAAGIDCRVHLKVETGVHRQGIVEGELPEALRLLDAAPDVHLVGVASHFADIEDTTDHRFAQRQEHRFDAFLAALAERGHTTLCRHMSCSAAAILWDRAQRDLVRVGIAGYGVWPSRETLVSAQAAGKNNLALEPAMTWKCRVSQVKQVPAGETVGYGCTWKAMTDTRIAVLPVGYADGYARALSGQAYVLIRGRQAPLRGRICMNLCMADVTHIEDATAGDWAVLLGRQEDERISAEQLAAYCNTIAYEVLTWPGESWRRDVV